MEDEIKRILDMVESGKIGTDEGARLINALNENRATSKGSAGGKSHWLKVIVRSKDEDRKENVNIRIPLGIVKAAIKIGAKFSSAIPKHAQEKMNEKGVDITELLKSDEISGIINNLDNTDPYTLVDIEDESEFVKIILE
ncbi:hypothetical protein KAU43_09470 [candidate division WOR-3 bacterium]|jgi:hypothetical protein|nr:hypothetical protein [candidate division WOR-3 bacterium]